MMMVPFELHSLALPYYQVWRLLHLQSQYPRSRSSPNSIISSSSSSFRLLVIKVASDNSLIGECGYDQTCVSRASLQFVWTIEINITQHTYHLPQQNYHLSPEQAWDPTPITFTLFRHSHLLLPTLYALYQGTDPEGREL